MRLIDTDAVIEAIDKHTFETDDGLCLDDDITLVLEEVPTIEERKKGEWITNLYAFGEDRYECDQCHHTALHCYDFCPNCGADMRGEQDE